jgi:hypothetical protein
MPTLAVYCCSQRRCDALSLGSGSGSWLLLPLLLLLLLLDFFGVV